MFVCVFVFVFFCTQLLYPRNFTYNNPPPKSLLFLKKMFVTFFCSLIPDFYYNYCDILNAPNTRIFCTLPYSLKLFWPFNYILTAPPLNFIFFLTPRLALSLSVSLSRLFPVHTLTLLSLPNAKVYIWMWTSCQYVLFKIRFIIVLLCPWMFVLILPYYIPPPGRVTWQSLKKKKKNKEKQAKNNNNNQQCCSLSLSLSLFRSSVPDLLSLSLKQKTKKILFTFVHYFMIVFLCISPFVS